MLVVGIEGEGQASEGSAREAVFKLPSKGEVAKVLAIGGLALSVLACRVGGGRGEGDKFWQREGYGSFGACVEAYYAVALFGSGEEYCDTGDNGYGN